MADRPNIVFILTDQQRLDTIAANGYDHMVTPHLDKLVAQGAVFKNMYVTAPSCAPSRASLFSGTYPHTNGVFRNDEPWNYCWVTELADAGYRCVNVGKMHTMPIEGSFGFHERHVVENKDRDHPNLPFYLDNWDKAIHARGAHKPSRVSYSKRPDYNEALGAFVWDQDEDLHPDVFVADTACWWLERYPGQEPFFLQVGFPGPHPPYDPTQEYLDLYLDKDLPKAILDYDLSTQPAPLQALRKNHLDSGHDAVDHLEHPTEDQLHRQRAHYYANVTMIDAQVGKIVQALEDRGVLENTLIIFTSDHGDCLNDHGHSQKWNMYEQSVHVPAVVCWPGVIEAGKQLPQLVSLFDFGPTILEAAGVSIPDWMEARTLSDVLFDTSDEPRERVFAEHSDDAILTETKFMTMVRKGNWKLVHFVDNELGQLFDLSADPDELVNLWDHADHSDTQRELINDILNWRIESSRKTQGFQQMLSQGKRPNL
ncbi:MAG: sulfatase-like hydrolase/transferase [Paracoccaceae bacterium]